MALLVLTATLPNRVAVVIFWNHRGLSGDSHIIWLFGGPCGLTPRRRCRPGSGATRAEPVFPTEREGPARGRRRHAVAVEALAPPDAARVAIRIATRVATVYTNAPKRRREAILTDLCTLLRPHVCPQQPNSVHKRPNPVRRDPILPFVYTIAIPRPPTTQAHGATVYTNAPKRHRGAISTDLCTLLRRRPGGEAHVVGAVTQPPTHTNSRSLYYLSHITCIVVNMLLYG